MKSQQESVMRASTILVDYQSITLLNQNNIVRLVLCPCESMSGVIVTIPTNRRILESLECDDSKAFRSLQKHMNRRFLSSSEWSLSPDARQCTQENPILVVSESINTGSNPRQAELRGGGKSFYGISTAIHSHYWNDLIKHHCSPQFQLANSSI